MTSNDFLNLVDERLKPLGFKKKRKTWYKDSPETITAFAVQQSRFGDVYFISLCTHFRALDEETRRPFYKFHSRIRAEHLGEETEQYLDFEESVPDGVRRQHIERLLNKSIAFLEGCMTLDGFRQVVHEFGPRVLWLKTEVQEYLGHSQPE